jgi:hypothetical protein
MSLFSKKNRELMVLGVIVFTLGWVGQVTLGPMLLGLINRFRGQSA